MQKKNEYFLEKIVKKDYNNELEKVLEKKYFKEDVKSILLSILYKIEASYKDYKQVKQNAETKEEFIENLIQNIEKNCDEIKLVKPHSKESEMLGEKTFLIEKKKKRIFCYQIERKLLYCIAKISKQEKIIKDQYFLIDETLSNLINVGDNINQVEPLRDFNGYSWTTIPREMESIDHNLLYQDLILLVGNQFMEQWVANEEYIIDYLELFKNKMEEFYGKELAEKYLENLKEISVLLEIKFDQKSKERLLKVKNEIENTLEKMENNQEYIENITKQKRKLTEEIRKIDETINNKSMLQTEYEKRNETLPLEEKIFSIRILSQLMAEEREKKLEKIEKLNDLLNPQKFVSHKKELEEKKKYLKLLDKKDLQKEIDRRKLTLQKIMIKAMKKKLDTLRNKARNVKIHL